MNPYEVLEINEGASQEEIKAAYRKMVKKYHPDKYQNNPLADLAEEKLREVNEAYDALTKNGGASNGGAYNNGGNYGNASGGVRNPQYQQIRRDLDMNRVAAAEGALNRMNNRDAEWMFLAGMVSYKKGWYDDAMTKIGQACQMDPNNMEYRSIFNSLRNQGGGFRGNAMNRGYGGGGNDAFCQALQCYCCMDMCCDCI